MLFDSLGRRYGKLPSQLLIDADSFDLMVFDVATTYEQHVNNKQQGKFDHLNNKDLEEEFNKIKEQRNARKNNS